MRLIPINTHLIFNRILDNPQRYGFLDSTTICTRSFLCSCNSAPPRRCHVWVDGFHPSREMQVSIGEEVFLAYLDQLRRGLAG
ncbi:hypothetical protein BDZ91DRAFT_748620 [Kalaharituber pfeilii]|nr:hypothetical protein BDZ91DRAFT_748620 [Kalaharituber pfeilii]